MESVEVVLAVQFLVLISPEETSEAAIGAVLPPTWTNPVRLDPEMSAPYLTNRALDV